MVAKLDRDETRPPILGWLATGPKMVVKSDRDVTRPPILAKTVAAASDSIHDLPTHHLEGRNKA